MPRLRPLATPAIVGALLTLAVAACDGGGDCTLEMGFEVLGGGFIAVGESTTPSARLTSCGGRETIPEEFRWRAADTTIVRVDSLTGRTTGLRPGTTGVSVRGVRVYRDVFGGVTVTVR